MKNLAQAIPAKIRTVIYSILAMAVVRSLGDYTLGAGGAALGVWDAAGWSALTNTVGGFWASRVLLGTAMAAVGLNTSFSVFRGMGLKPFAVGLAGAAVVGLVGMTMAIVVRVAIRISPTTARRCCMKRCRTSCQYVRPGVRSTS